MKQKLLDEAKVDHGMIHVEGEVSISDDEDMVMVSYEDAIPDEPAAVQPETIERAGDGVAIEEDSETETVVEVRDSVVEPTAVEELISEQQLAPEESQRSFRDAESVGFETATEVADSVVVHSAAEEVCETTASVTEPVAASTEALEVDAGPAESAAELISDADISRSGAPAEPGVDIADDVVTNTPAVDLTEVEGPKATTEAISVPPVVAKEAKVEEEKTNTSLLAGVGFAAAGAAIGMCFTLNSLIA